MAYPLPVTEQPLVEPRGRPTNIKTVIDPPAVEAWDYFPTQSRVTGARMNIFNAISTPWWAIEEP